MKKNVELNNALYLKKVYNYYQVMLLLVQRFTHVHMVLQVHFLQVWDSQISLFGMITGGNWFKIPESIKVVFKGKPAPFVTGKDLILEIIRILGVDGALYIKLQNSQVIQSNIYQWMIDSLYVIWLLKLELKMVSLHMMKLQKSFQIVRKSLRAEPKIHYSDE